MSVRHCANHPSLIASLPDLLAHTGAGLSEYVNSTSRTGGIERGNLIITLVSQYCIDWERLEVAECIPSLLA